MGAHEAAESGISRGQSNPIAIVLIFGLVIASTTIVVAFGASAITTTQDQLDSKSVESRMAQLDSQMATVALGQTQNRQVALGSTSSNAYDVNASAGRVELSHQYEDPATGTETTDILMDESLGSISYEGDSGKEVAYQGGGVWRNSDTGSSVMVSPPEFHYRQGTLTLPLVTVNNNASFSGDAEIRANDSTQVYPTGSQANPLEEGRVWVNITSQYHEAWESYLETRTEGSVRDIDPNDNTVNLLLMVPVTEDFEDTAAATSGDSDALETTGSGSIESPTDTGVNAPPVDSLVESEIAQCEANPSECDAIPGSGTMGPGTYYAGSNTDVTLGDVDFDTNGGEIDVVVDGDLDFGGNDISIDDGGTVTFYVKGGGGEGIDATSNTDINEPGDSEDLLVIAHSDVADSNNGMSSDADILIRGGTFFNGLIYAPDSDFTVRGSSTFNGAIVINEADARGGAAVTRPADGIDSEFTYASSSVINYLHVSENSVNVTAR